MPTLNEWKKFNNTERETILKDYDNFSSYSKEHQVLAEQVAEDLRVYLNVGIEKMSAGNKGGYILIVAVIPAENYDYVLSKNIEKHLGFNICFIKGS